MTDAVMAQVVEHVLGKDEVTSSNLVSSSIKRIRISFTVYADSFVLPAVHICQTKGNHKRMVTVLF